MGTLPRATDVFVVGGGPAGLATAIAARQAGLEVVVADRARPPIDKACGEGLMPDGVRALRRLGIDIDPDHGRPFRGIRFVDGDLMAEATFTRGLGIGIRRTELHSMLVARAEEVGAVALWRTAVDGVDGTGVRIGDAVVRCRWIVGADGIQSRVRAWAGITPRSVGLRRVGLRRRFRIPPWTDFVEVHWRTGSQAYVTPVSADEVCVTTVTAASDARQSMGPDAFPSLSRRLAGAEPISPVRGAITMSARLTRATRGRIALVGDASGSVDAVTGEGLSLAFSQAAALAGAMGADDLRAYETCHRDLAWRPRLMAQVLLLMSGRDTLRRWALRGLATWPAVFERLLAFHLGDDELTGVTPQAIGRACDPA